MGWYGSTKKYGETTKEFLLREYNSEQYPIIEIAIKNFTTAYVLHKDTKSNEVIASVFLLRYEKDSFGNTEIMVKTMDEFNHPYYYDMPEKMFWKLTPILDDRNTTWRQEVLKRIEKKKAVKKLKIGEDSIIKFKEEINFTNGFKSDTFQIHKGYKGKGFIFRNFKSSIGYKITNWRKREFEIISEQEYMDMKRAEQEKLVKEFV
jgi:hypothetical protein